jgi:arylsulfatase A
MRFTDFYMASAICSASRASMLTGCYPQRIGFARNEVLFPGQNVGLHPNESTIADALKKVGYRTKIVGKWHCGDQPTPPPPHMALMSSLAIPTATIWGDK